jgi:RNA polymerase sigma factor (sigma-70 family)
MMMARARATDGKLLDSFVAQRDCDAFRDLVARHGPAVRRICRGVLHDSHEADDAFQATFLVLVRKAPSIEDPERLGGWLRGVAYRIALHARGRQSRRRAVETSWAALSRGDPPPAELTPELRRVIGEELDRLPDSYRQAVTLCYLQGLTHQETARRLGSPIGTVKVHLVRARRLLRERLKRRGIGWEAGLLLFLLRPRNASAPRAGLDASTIRAMALAAAGCGAALATRFAHALELAEANPDAVIGLKALWICAVPALAGVVLAFCSPALLAYRTPLAPDVDAASLPGNLTDVLTVECR